MGCFPEREQITKDFQANRCIEYSYFMLLILFSPPLDATFFSALGNDLCVYCLARLQGDESSNYSTK